MIETEAREVPREEWPEDAGTGGCTLRRSCGVRSRDGVVQVVEQYVAGPGNRKVLTHARCADHVAALRQPV